MDCYEVIESYDRDTSHIAFVSSESLAREVVNSRDACYRSFHPYKKSITIFESMEEIQTTSKENLIKSALSKLTANERSALGL